MLIGEYRYSVDSKGRIFIPAKMRDENTGSFIISKAMDDCLNLYTIEQWNKFAEKLTSLPSVETREIQRFIFSTANELPLDSQGRICIPAGLREYAKIGSEAVIVGVQTRIEIWSPENYDKMEGAVDKKSMISFLIQSGF